MPEVGIYRDAQSSLMQQEVSKPLDLVSEDRMVPAAVTGENRGSLAVAFGIKVSGPHHPTLWLPQSPLTAQPFIRAGIPVSYFCRCSVLWERHR